MSTSILYHAFNLKGIEYRSTNKMEILKGDVRSNHIHVLIGTPAYLSPTKILQYLKGKSSYRLQREFPKLQKIYRGRHFWSRGYFGATVGAVTEEQIRQYIENQSDDPNSFKVWDESEPEFRAQGKVLFILSRIHPSSVDGFSR